MTAQPATGNWQLATENRPPKRRRKPAFALFGPVFTTSTFRKLDRGGETPPQPLTNPVVKEVEREAVRSAPARRLSSSRLRREFFSQRLCRRAAVSRMRLENERISRP